jgi:subtilisin-like proprotein convertase family protein
MRYRRFHFICLLIFFFAAHYVSLSQSVQERCRIVSINIPDHSTKKDSILDFLGIGVIITDVNLKIDDLRHTWVGDLSIYLSRGNIGIRIFNKTGGSGDNFIGTIFNDSAEVLIDSGAAPFTGSFRPVDSLRIFNGDNDYTKSWILTITDTATGDTGLLSKWCLVVSYFFYTGGIQTVEIPNTYRLYQNYPNPFNPVSKIKYGVPKNGYVKLAVYDEIGRLVAILQDGEKQANTYEAEFDATNLPSGVYYYKLEAEGFSETKKMVVVK